MKLKTAVRLFKWFIKAPGWLKGLLLTVVLVLLLLLPVVGLLVGVLLVVSGLLALILWPFTRGVRAVRRRFR